jgi:GNAT superfamily N-acetyltransferase
LNTSLHSAAEQWIGLINGEFACHVGLIQFPMRKGWKRVHRLVVLPDYQGVGIGTKFQDMVIKKYNDDNWNINCTTTTPSLVSTMRRNKKWKLVRFGRAKGKWQNAMGSHLNNAMSNNRVTYSFNFIK